jgi:hypothetical protein
VAGEAVEATAEDAADPTVDAVEDTASPAAWVTAGTGEAPVGESAAGAAATGVLGPAETEPAETGPEEAGAGEAGAGEEGAPGSGGSCAAEAGRAKITARTMASTKTAARPPQAHTKARRDQAPAFLDSPIRERTGTFPSTTRKPRQTHCYRAINLTM